MDGLTLRAIAADTTSHTIDSIRSNRALVQSVQASLNRIGHTVGTATGDWNHPTDVAYRAFTAKHKLAPDELSPRSASLLLSLPTVHTPPTPAPSPPSISQPAPISQPASAPTPASPAATPTPQSASIAQPAPISQPPPQPAPRSTPSPAPSPAPTEAQIFQEALRFTLRWEGGYVNHPADRGGETNCGITTAIYRAYRQGKGLPVQSVQLISEAEVREIYERLYWRPAQCGMMQRPLAIAHFDTAVSFGVGGATMFLQDLLGLRVDRVFGPITQRAIAQASHLDLAQRLCQARIDYRYRRVTRDAAQRVFLQSWLNRDTDLLNFLTPTPAP